MASEQTEIGSEYVQQIITPGEIQAELNSLRNLRRRSLSQPSEGIIDPDLPTGSSSSAASNVTNSTGPLSNLAFPLNSSSTASILSSALPANAYEGASSSTPPEISSDSDTALPLSDLFWLPAHLHPEIAPQKFKQFLREQTKPENLSRRTSGKANGGLDRRKSTLSRQYDPSTLDSSLSMPSLSEDGDDSSSTSTTASSEQRNLSSSSSLKKKKTALEGLTISDLQKLEQLAIQAAQEGGQDEEAQIRLSNLLRGSLSLEGSQSSDQESDTSLEEADSPLIVPAPGSILRRSARTKIRKSSLLGDGGGHRFAATRRTKIVSPQGEDQLEPKTPESQKADPMEDIDSPGSPNYTASSPSPSKSATRLSAGFHRPTSASYTEPAQVLQDPIQMPSQPVASTSKTLPAVSSRPQARHQRSLSGDSFLQDSNEFSALPSTQQAAEPAHAFASPSLENQFETYPGKRHISPPRKPDELSKPATIRRHSEDLLSRPSEPNKSSNSQQQSFTAVTSPPKTISVPPPTTPVPSATSKEKKSAWARFGLARTTSSSSTSSSNLTNDESLPQTQHIEEETSLAAATASTLKKGKKTKKPALEAVVDDAVKREKERDREKEKEREHSSFFGGLFGGKKRATHDSVDGVPKEAAAQQALSPTASGMLGKGGKYTNFYRLPIHVERAVYRLSHIKLANPRRPLYEQVLISNLMFWYLSVINKPQPQSIPQAIKPQPHQESPASVSVQEGRQSEEDEQNTDAAYASAYVVSPVTTAEASHDLSDDQPLRSLRIAAKHSERTAPEKIPTQDTPVSKHHDSSPNVHHTAPQQPVQTVLPLAPKVVDRVPRNEGFEVMHRSKENRNALSKSAGPSTRDSLAAKQKQPRSVSGQADSSWMTTSNGNVRSAQDQSTYMPEPITMPPSHTVELKTMDSHTTVPTLSGVHPRGDSLQPNSRKAPYIAPVNTTFKATSKTALKAEARGKRAVSPGLEQNG